MEGMGIEFEFWKARSHLPAGITSKDRCEFAVRKLSLEGAANRSMKKNGWSEEKRGIAFFFCDFSKNEGDGCNSTELEII